MVLVAPSKEQENAGVLIALPFFCRRDEKASFRGEALELQNEKASIGRRAFVQSVKQKGVFAAWHFD